MERVVHHARSFEEAAEWDVRQQIEMSPQQRLQAALALKRRAFKADSKDVRECHRKS